MNNEIQVEEHTGLIVQIVLRYWKKLPAYYQAFYAVDDMISDARLHLLRKRGLYERHRGGISSFVHTVVRNYCLQVLEGSFLSIRFVNSVELDESVCEPPDTNDTRPDDFISFDAVQRLIQEASPLLKAYLASNLFGEPRQVFSQYDEELARAEFDRLVGRLKVGYNDFHRVLMKRA